MSTPARATPQVIAGSCLITIQATWMAAAEEVRLEDDGTGTCATNQGTARPVLEGVVSDISDLAPITCAEIVADGGVEIDLIFEEGQIKFPGATLAVAKIGDSVTLGFATPDLMLVGAAQFVQTTPTALACMEGTNPIIWTGTLTFQDPVLTE